MAAPNVTPSTGLLSQLAALVAMSEPLNGLELRLFTNNTALGVGTVLANLTELTTEQFPGYAAATFTWGAPYYDLAGLANVAGSRCQFTPNAAVPSPGVTVYGYYATDAATGLILAFAGLFATPYNITEESQAILWYPTYTLAGPG